MATDLGGDWSKFGLDLIGVWVRFSGSVSVVVGRWVFRWW